MGTRIALLSCLKSKRAAASPARELYTSQLFRGLRAYAEAHADAWYILSAEHGVLRPDDVIAPYEKTLTTMRKRDRVAWAGRVQLPPFGFAIFTLVLGNVFAATGWGKWFPYAIVPLSTGIAGPRASVLEPASYVVVLMLCAAGVAATIWQMRTADNAQ